MYTPLAQEQIRTNQDQLRRQVEAARKRRTRSAKPATNNPAA